MFKPFSITLSLFLLFIQTAAAAEIGTRIEIPCPFGDCKAGIGLSYLGEFDIPTGFGENGVEVGGHYIAISDDRSERGPARFYHLDIDVGASGLKGVTILDHVTLLDKNGLPFMSKGVDPESIRIGKDGIYWSSEGDAKTLTPPFVRVAKPDGAFIRELPLPDGFAPTDDKSTGVRDNLAFKSTTFLPSGDLLIGMESALYQDGPIATLTNGSLARIIRYEPSTGVQQGQYGYLVSPIPRAPSKSGGWNDFGVSSAATLKVSATPSSSKCSTWKVRLTCRASRRSQTPTGRSCLSARRRSSTCAPLASPPTISRE